MSKQTNRNLFFPILNILMAIVSLTEKLGSQTGKMKKQDFTRHATPNNYNCNGMSNITFLF